MQIRKCSLLLALIFLAQMSVASPVRRVRMECLQMDEASQSIQGDQDPELVEIASLSKIFTTDWVVASKGINARLLTRVVVQPRGPNEADVHLLGARDPGFGRTSFQLLVAGLNQQGIQKIHQLSFDDNFKYFDQPDSDSVAHDFFTDLDPTTSRIERELRSTLSSLSSGYSSLARHLKEQGVTDLPRKLKMQVSSIVSLDSWDSGAQDAYFQMASPSMLALLRQMNAQSNNYFADQLFLGLGGADAMAEQLQSHMGMDQNSVILVNGSGDRYPSDNSRRPDYNRANCPAVLHALRFLRTDLQALQMDLSSVLPIVGLDTDSTVDVYSSSVTRRAVVAKSGTINLSVGLAGWASTQRGGMFFVSVLGPGLTEAEREADRADIQMDLEKSMETKGGPVEVKPAQRLKWGHDSATILTPIPDGTVPATGIVWSVDSN